MSAISIIILIDLGGAEGALAWNRVFVLIVYILCVLRVLVGCDVGAHKVVVVDELHVGEAAVAPAHASGLGLASTRARLVHLHRGEDLVMVESRVLANRLSLVLLLSLLELVVEGLELLLLLVQHEALGLGCWVLVPVVAVVKGVLLECILGDADLG